MKPIVYARRLLKLADILEALPKEKFDYGVWSRRFHGHGFPPAHIPSCGTTACALGWAVSHPDFKACARRQGHTVGLRGYYDPYEGNINYDVVVDGQAATPDGEWSERKASRLLFGLDEYEHEKLFIPGSDGKNESERNATPKYVAKKIRKFVKNKYGKEVLNG